MSDAAETTVDQPEGDTKPVLSLRTQYIKDVSFESPRAPASLFTMREAPNVEVSVNLLAQRLDSQAVELSFQIGVRAVADKNTIFLVDMVYAGILEIRNIADAEMEEAIFVRGAQQLFPFARRVISDLTRDGGFPPIQLEPMDFAAMYVDQKSRAAMPGTEPRVHTPVKKMESEF